MINPKKQQGGENQAEHANCILGRYCLQLELSFLRIYFYNQLANTDQSKTVMVEFCC